MFSMRLNTIISGFIGLKWKFRRIRWRTKYRLRAAPIRCADIKISPYAFAGAQTNYKGDHDANESLTFDIATKYSVGHVVRNEYASHHVIGQYLGCPLSLLKLFNEQKKSNVSLTFDWNVVSPVENVDKHLDAGCKRFGQREASAVIDSLEALENVLTNIFYGF